MCALLSELLAADAADVLDRSHIPHGQIVSVDRDSILYHGPGGACTAWLHRDPQVGVRVMSVQRGFVAVEPYGLHIYI